MQSSTSIKVASLAAGSDASIIKNISLCMQLANTLIKYNFLFDLLQWQAPPKTPRPKTTRSCSPSRCAAATTVRHRWRVVRRRPTPSWRVRGPRTARRRVSAIVNNNNNNNIRKNQLVYNKSVPIAHWNLGNKCAYLNRDFNIVFAGTKLSTAVKHQIRYVDGHVRTIYAVRSDFTS